MKRDKSLDIAKGIAIILMMYGHLRYTWSNMDSVYGWISSFHMPFFIYITGLLTNVKETEKWQQVLAKARRVLVPYAVWNVVGYVVHSALKLQDQGFVQFVKGVVAGNNLNNNLPTWYLLAFFWISLFGIFVLPMIDTKKRLVIALVISVAAVFAIGMFTEVADYFRWKGVVTLLPFFLLGYLLKKIEFRLPWHLILLFFYAGYKTYRMNAVASWGYVVVGNGTVGEAHLYLVSATFTTLALIETCRYLEKIPVCQILAVFGKHSLIILCTHWLFGNILLTRIEYGVPLFIAVLIIECVIIGGLELYAKKKETK
ncbi:MAG: acyltransferase family protein [Roseburia sp.]|nr:acyltransferase family protein [Roseburia sp.]